MKTPILISRISLAAVALHATTTLHLSAQDRVFDSPGRGYREQAAPPKPADVKPPVIDFRSPEERKHGRMITSGGDARATIIMDVDGKKETRTFQLRGDQPLTLDYREGNVVRVGEGTLRLAPREKETWIGMSVSAAISPEVRAQLPIHSGEGVIVSHVVANSPAAIAGLAEHDILVRFDDQILVSADQFKKLVQMRKPGELAKIAYFRKGERREVQVGFNQREVQPEPQDVLNVLTEPLDWEMKIEALPEGKKPLNITAPEAGPLKLREKLKEVKERYPGVVVNRQAYVLNVDGTVKRLEGELESLEAAMKKLREELEKANIPQETVQEVRKAVEAAIGKAGEAVGKAAVEALREYRDKREEMKSNLEAEKPAPPSQPDSPAPSIKPAQ